MVLTVTGRGGCVFPTTLPLFWDCCNDLESYVGTDFSRPKYDLKRQCTLGHMKKEGRFKSKLK